MMKMQYGSSLAVLGFDGICFEKHCYHFYYYHNLLLLMYDFDGIINKINVP